jgi:hypothetical protein
MKLAYTHRILHIAFDMKPNALERPTLARQQTRRQVQRRIAQATTETSKAATTLRPASYSIYASHNKRTMVTLYSMYKTIVVLVYKQVSKQASQQAASTRVDATHTSFDFLAANGGGMHFSKAVKCSPTLAALKHTRGVMDKLPTSDA